MGLKERNGSSGELTTFCGEHRVYTLWVAVSRTSPATLPNDNRCSRTPLDRRAIGLLANTGLRRVGLCARALAAQPICLLTAKRRVLLIIQWSPAYALARKATFTNRHASQ